VWPANALTLGLLLRMPPDRRSAIWLAAPVAFVAADLVTGTPLSRAILLNTANFCGVAAAYAVTRFAPESALELREPQSVLWYVLVSAVGAAAAGFFAAMAEPFPLGLDRFGTWKFWFASELINYIALLPLILSMPPMRSLIPVWSVNAYVSQWRAALPAVTLIGVCALAIFAGGPGAIAFAVPALIWCGLVYSVFFVSILAFAFASWSSIVISGEYLHSLAGAFDGGAIVSLRLAAFMIALAPITLAIVMRNRDELAQKLSVTRQRVDMALEAGGVIGIWDLNVAANTMRIEGIDPDSREISFWREWSVERALSNVHPDDRKRVRDGLSSSIVTGTDFHGTYQDLAFEGQPRWIAAFGKPVFDQGNAVSHVIGVFINLTEQMKAAEALELSDKRFNIVSESIPDIVWSTDAEGRHDYFNRRWHEFTGIDPNDIEPETWTALVHPADERRVMETWTACLKTGNPYSIDYRFRHHDGKYRWLRVQAKPLRNAQDVIVRWYGTSTDIDDAKRLEAEREAVAGELDHRIGNLFALVNGLVNVSVRDGDTGQAVADAIRGRLSALHDAHGLVRRSGGGSGVMMVELSRTLLRPYDDGSGRISVSGDDVRIAASAVTPLALVFHELATNAVKYGALRDDKSVLRARLSRWNDRLIINWKERCLSPSPVSAGTGFGSKLFKAIVEEQLHGTTVRVSTPEGLIVEMSLPLSSLVGTGASKGSRGQASQ
jgi:PAS domain S-box-containing protein